MAPTGVNTAASPLTFSFQQRQVTVHPVLETELTTLKNSGPTLPVAFFTLCIGTAVAFGIVAFSQRGLTNRSHAAYLALFWVSVVAGLFFALGSLRAWRKSGDLIDQIKKRTPLN